MIRRTAGQLGVHASVEDESPAVSGSETAAPLAKYRAGVRSSLTPSESPPTTTSVPTMAETPLTEEEVVNVLRPLVPYKSPDSAGIHAKTLKEMPQ